MPDSAPASDDSSKPSKPRGRRILIWILGLLLLVVLAVGAAVGYGAWLFHKDPGPEQEVMLVIPRGSGLMSVAGLLEKEGVVSDRRLFAAGTHAYGASRQLRAGEYRIAAGATMFDVMQQLREGRTFVRQITIPEGLSVKQIAGLLEGEPMLSGKLGDLPPEGSVLPETYHFSRGDDRAALLARMKQAMDHALESLWPQRAENLPLKTPEEALILASIVEKETAIPAERPRIAAVFINRLRKGMKLQSDPTIIYGLTGGEPLGRPIRQSELDRQTDYNTYHFAGLPPTPIANPGIDAIRAVLNPLESKELYFVADGTGGHVFSSTYREHQQNVRKWRRIERGKQ